MNSLYRAALLTILPICAAARADIAYDNLSHDAFDGGIISQSEIAQQITLEPGTGRVLDGLSMRLSNGDIVSDSAGFLTMSVYTDAGDLPGSLLASATIRYDLPIQTFAVYSTSFSDGPQLPDLVWIAWQIQEDGGSGPHAGVTYGGQPLHGTTSNLFAVTNRNGEWDHSDPWLWDPFQIRVTTVPTPSALAAFFTLAVLRRRR